MRIPALMFAGVMFVGCEEIHDVAADVVPPDTSLRGIYSLDNWTQNIAGCDGEGEANPLFREDLLFGIHPDADPVRQEAWLHAFTCIDADHCESRAEQGSLAGLDPTAWRLEEGSDATGWTAISDVSRETDGELCEGVREVVTLTADADGFRLIVQNFRVDDHPQTDGDDPCPDELVEANLGECYKLEGISGTFLETMSDF